MAAERKGFLLRVSPELLEQLRGWAEQEMRSVNAQIEWILRDAVRRRRRAVEEKGPGESGGEPPTPRTS